MTDSATTPPIRLMVVDDQPLIRRALTMMLGAEPDVEIAAEAGDGVEAVKVALATRPDVVIMDLQMPRASGVVATREITAKLPGTRIVVLTTYDHDELVFEAIRAGAHAYLLKDASEADMLDAVRAVHLGESRLSPSIARKVMEQFRSLPRPSASGAEVRPPPVAAGDAVRKHEASVHGTQVADPLQEPLTDKEELIIELIAQGKSNKQIAANVFLAEGTVKNYVSRIMEKLHARSRTELAVRAVERRT